MFLGGKVYAPIHISFSIRINKFGATLEQTGKKNWKRLGKRTKKYFNNNNNMG